MVAQAGDLLDVRGRGARGALLRGGAARGPALALRGLLHPPRQCAAALLAPFILAPFILAPSSRTLSDQASRHHSDGPSLHRSCRRDCSDGSRLAGQLRDRCTTTKRRRRCWAGGRWMRWRSTSRGSCRRVRRGRAARGCDERGGCKAAVRSLECTAFTSLPAAFEQGGLDQVHGCAKSKIAEAGEAAFYAL